VNWGKGAFDALMFGVTFGLVLVFSARRFFGVARAAEMTMH